jgi:hypothetical protein
MEWLYKKQNEKKYESQFLANKMSNDKIEKNTNLVYPS